MKTLPITPGIAHKHYAMGMCPDMKQQVWEYVNQGPCVYVCMSVHACVCVCTHVYVCGGKGQEYSSEELLYVENHLVLRSRS